MRIEDLQYDFFPKPPVDEKNWNKEQWLKENPIDYYKMMALFNRIDIETFQMEALKILYEVVRLYIPDTLFKYFYLSDDTELNTKKFNTLANRQLFLSEIKNFNDPFDSKGFFYDPKQLSSISRLKSAEGRLIDDFTSYIRSTSLSANGIQSLPMWAHYSNNHAGYCVSYDMKSNIPLSSCTFPVQYTNERLDITSVLFDMAKKISDKVDANVAAGIKTTVIEDSRILIIASFLNNIKHTSWSYENEFRCTMGAKAESIPYIEANPKEIYIGMNCSDDNTNQLLTIGNQLSVPVYKMYFDELCSEYKLNYSRLN